MLAGLLAGRMAGEDPAARGRALRLGALASSLLVERPGLDSVPTVGAIRAREADLRTRH